MKTKSYKLTAPLTAKEQGFSAITSGYASNEYWMLDRVIEDMRGIVHMLVKSAEGIHVYRKKVEITFAAGTRSF